MAIIRNGNPKNIAIHHSAVNPPAMNITELKARATSHNNYHRTKSEGWNNTTPGELGYKWIRYHYMIAQDGSVLQVQDEKYVLYHSSDGATGQFNYWGIAIMLEGNYETAQPTDAMMKSLVLLIRDIEKRYNIDPMVRGHKEISATTSCPGVNIGTSKSGWLKNVINNVNDKSYPQPIDWTTETIKLPQTTECELIRDTALFNIDTGERVKEFKKGDRLDLDYQYKSFLLTAWSFERKIKNGFRLEDLTVYTAPLPDPTPEPPSEPEQPEEPVEIPETPPTEPEPPVEEPETPGEDPTEPEPIEKESIWVYIYKWILSVLVNIFSSRKNK